MKRPIWPMIVIVISILSSCGRSLDVRKGAVMPQGLNEPLTSPELPVRGKAVRWNLQKKLTFSIPGSYKKWALPEVSILLMDGRQEMPLPCQVVWDTETNILVEVEYNPKKRFPQKHNFYLRITRYDKNSKDNQTETHWVTIQPDYYAPFISILSSSPYIRRGGSALIVFEARDEKVRSAYVVDNRGKIFIPQPFIKEGYFTCFLGWYLSWTDYQAWVVAEDEAGNVSTNQIPLITKQTNYRILNYRFNRTYNNPIGSLMVQDQNTQTNMAINEFFTEREKQWLIEQRKEGKINNIVWLTSLPPEKTVTNFEVTPFDPVGPCRVSAEYGQLRNYHYRYGVVRQAYHTGIDLTLIEKMPIYVSNPGTVVMATYNSGYGNMIIIDHGMGVYTLYAHCSEYYVKVGDKIKAGQMIARTGRTGQVTGDHLHFSLLIQGVFVDPSDWMEQEWVDVNVNQVIDRARRGIFLRPEGEF